MSTCKRMKIDPYLSLCTKLKSMWIKDLNINPVTLNLREEKMGSSLEHKGTGEYNPSSTDTRAKINKWDLLKLRSFCKAKDMVKRKNLLHVGI